MFDLIQTNCYHATRVYKTTFIFTTKVSLKLKHHLQPRVAANSLHHQPELLSVFHLFQK